MNAQQLHLTGCCLVYHDINMVVVEGRAKELKKYKNLMLHKSGHQSFHCQVRVGVVSE